MPKKMKMSTIFMECSYSIAESKLNYKYEQIISMKDNLLFFFFSINGNFYETCMHTRLMLKIKLTLDSLIWFLPNLTSSILL